MGYTNMTDDEVFSSLLPTIKNIYKAFKYTGISFDDYSDIVLDEISEMDGKVEETVFKNKLKKRMNNEVSKMLTDSDTASRIISSYLDVKVPKVDSYESAMKAFKKLEASESFVKKIFIDVVTDDAFVHIIVADNGTGILLPTDDITEPFVTGKKNGAGMGLGLHIASEVLNAQGGKLSFPDWGDFDIPNEFEQGATVVLSLKK